MEANGGGALTWNPDEGPADLRNALSWPDFVIQQMEDDEIKTLCTCLSDGVMVYSSYSGIETAAISMYTLEQSLIRNEHVQCFTDQAGFQYMECCEIDAMWQGPLRMAVATCVH